ncbi:hypothetical protein L1987_66565 [Smallanthus sonchifolius]|uniref:Uncharacterized protein n=1 Tax=Smallanthus sonchifolius TaxID=185202 RepID=A0ACB9BXM7_9ASTR|nr:hypothetical protein L1987_66565 [Smallanthus sonchifolius]
MARDKARAHASSSVSQGSLDPGDLCNQPLDALQQFNMLYNKISQRSKYGLDRTTHVTQLHEVPGFTCFINESASQPKKGTENQKSSVTNNIHPSVKSNKRDIPEKQTSPGIVEFSRLEEESLSDDKIFKTFEADLKSHPSTASSPPAASQPKKKTENQKSFVTDNIPPGVNSNKGDFPEKQISQGTAEFRSSLQDESLSDDKILKTFEDDLKSHPSQVSSPPAASQPKKETENQKSFVTDNIHPSVSSNKEDFPEKQISQGNVEFKSRLQDESLSDDKVVKTFEADLKSRPSTVSSPPANSQPKKETENQKSFVTDNIHPSVNSNKWDFPEIETSQGAVEFRSRYQDESLLDDRNFKTFEVDLKSHPSKVSSPPAASQPKKETENQKSFVTDNIHPSVNSNKGDFPKKQISQGTVELKSRLQDESLSDDRILKTFEADLKSHPSTVSSPPAASQPKKETENQKSFVTDNIHPSVNSNKWDFPEIETSQGTAEFRSRYQDESLSDDRIFKTFEVDLKPHPSKVSPPPVASQPNKETQNQKSYVTHNIHPNMNSSKGDFHEKQTSQSAVESRSRYQDESSSGDRIFKTFEVDLKPHPSKVSSPPAASQPNKESENQKSYITNNIHPSVNSSKGDFHEKQTSQSAAESSSRYGEEESIYDDRNFKTFQADLRSHPPKVSSSPATSSTDYQKRSTATYGEFLPTCFDEELDVNSAAAVSAAALRKAVEKAQESIRIAKESVGRKKGLGGFSSKCFKDSLKVKAKVVNANAGEEHKEKDDKMKEKDDKMKEKDHKHGSTVVFPHFVDDENLFGAKKVIKELHGNISELDKNSEIPTRSPFELRENERVCNSEEVVGKTESESIENNMCEGPQKVVEKFSGFLVLENREKKLGDTESNNLTMYQRVEEEKKISGKSDENDYEKKFSGELFGLFETNKQENLEQENDEKVASVSQVEDEREVKEEGKFYNVCEVGLIKNAETYNCCIETNDFSRKEDHEINADENHKAEETWKKLDKVQVQVPETYENSSSYHDDAEESKSVIGGSQIVDYTKEACKLDQNENNAESSHEFQVEDAEAIEKETENISSNETEDKKDECDAKSDDLANCGLADVDFVQNVYSIEKNDFSHTEDHEIKERENHKAEETWKKLDKIEVPKTYENSSSDYDEEEESVIRASQVIDDTEEASKVDQHNNNAESSQVDDVSSSSSGHDFQVENTEALEKEACKVDQNDNNAESSQEIDDVSSSSSSGHDFQVEDIEALEKEMIENISSDETEGDEDECDAKSDDLANCGLADVDFVQNDVQSESSSDTILGMQIEVKEYKEREEAVEKEDDNVQQSHEETPEVRTKMETGSEQEPEDASRESEPSKMVEEVPNKEEMERERLKIAVERAIREARERAFAEVRQRVIADTQEKVTKASSDKTCAQSKLRAERAAVERATAEARQRALEKAISQKKISEPKVQVIEINQTTSAINHTNTESVLRSKAKVEKHNRIMERAAKALAEKEMRDLLAVREQAERSRLAENLDADIKRWSNGKEGNLRALLSTLQYILGAESGWQPVSLTEIITTSAVKKAYRKATLCVHPDKLQQRGANIQQKYICEKVFDLLKAAWNRFNSEER